jgi:hypothetical protein
MEAAVQPSEAVQTERRFEPRFKAADMPSITGVRLSPLGIKAQLVDISTTGVLIECGTRIQPGSNVNVTFEGDPSLPTVGGRIARTTVAALDQSGSLRYHVGIAFSAPIPLKTPAAPAVSVVAAPVAPEPIQGPVVEAPPVQEPVVEAPPVPFNRW